MTDADRAENVTKLTAICSTCYGDAAFFFKNDPDLGNQGSDLVGGADKYTASCRSCYRARPTPPATGDNNNANKDALNNAAAASSGPKAASRPKVTSRAAPSGLKVTHGPKSTSGATPSRPKVTPGPKVTFEATPSGPKMISGPTVNSGAPPKSKKVRFGPTVEDFKPQAPQPPPPSPAELHPYLIQSDAESLESGDITDDLLYSAVVAHITTENMDNPSGSHSL